MTIRLNAAVCLVVCGAASCTPGSNYESPPFARLDGVTALVDRGDYQGAEITARALAEELRRTNGERSLAVAAANDRLLQALVANGKGASPEAIVLAEQTLQLTETLVGGEHPDTVSAVQTLGDVLRSRGEATRAIEVFERVAGLRERVPQIDKAALARVLDRLSTTYREASRYDDAVATARRSLALKEGVAERRELARTLEVLALALLRRGHDKEAGEFVDRAFELRRGHDEGHPEFVATLSMVADYHWANGRLIEARDTAARALALAQRTLHADHPIVADCLRQLAVADLDLWDLEAAHDLNSRSVAIAQRAYGSSHPAIAEHLNDLANATFLLGDYPEARRLYERSLTIRERQYGPKHDSVATALYNLALVDASLGDYQRSRREYERAALVWEELRGPSHRFVAQALAAQAIVIRDHDSAPNAIPLFERALSINEVALGPQHRLVAETLTDLALTYSKVRRNADAVRLTERAQQIWTANGNPDDHAHAITRALTGQLAFDRGELALALRAYGRALTIEERVFGRTHPETAQVRLAMARIQALSQRASAALASAQDAESSGREHLRLILRALAERQALNYAAVRPRGLDLMLSLVGTTRNASLAAIDAIIRSRALVLDEISARRRVSTTPASRDDDTLLVALAKTQQRLANLVVQGAGAMPRARYDQLVEAAREESELAERRLAEASVAFRAERSRSNIGVDEVMSALPQDTVLVSFVRYQQLRLDARVTRADAGSPGSETPSYLAFVLRARHQPQAVKLGDASTIEELVSTWRSDIASDALAPAAGRAQSRTSGMALKAATWDRVAALLTGVTTIFIVSDGALGLVPFAALPAGDDAFLLERTAPIHYLTAERDLVPAPDDVGARGEGLLALGGATFDSSSPATAKPSRAPSPGASPGGSSDLRAASLTCGGLRDHRFEPLAATMQEVQDVSRIWSAAQPGSNGSPQVLTGENATERAVKQGAPKHLVLHLATHGFFLDESCSSGPSATPATSATRGVGGLSSTGPVQNPLRLSGLALAGANGRGQAGPDEEDGILTAEEVASLDLQGVEWAVLSACDSGVGEIKAGEGVFGLRRAFQVAGARTVIMSLWSVDDQATRAWMRALYEGRFQRQLSTADAVHQASLAVLRERRTRGQSTHPFFWAAFVAAGDWR